MIAEKDFRKVLEFLGFEPESKALYSKNIGGHLMQVDFEQKRLIYPKAVSVERNTTSNFIQSENFVVFECVHRLLDMGYKPEDLVLERTWQLGHSAKSARADITIFKEKTKGEKEVYCIIECKTAGSEFKKAREYLLTDDSGSQLFSYAAQARSVEYLALYASDFEEGEIKIYEDIIKFKDDSNILDLSKKDTSLLTFEGASEAKDFYRVWDETYSKRRYQGIIFDSKPYEIGIKPLLKKDLKPFDKSDGINIKFQEILRRNSVSDKENAFNKLLSLFLCKCVDEQSKKDDEELDFQYKVFSDDYFSLYERILKLFIKGMNEFLKEEVYKTEDNFIAKTLQTYLKKDRKAMQKILEEELLKATLFSSNAFSFKETHNEDLFKQNGKILVEVVELLSPYQISYSSKHQFLGELFETFLNEGFKEDEGRYFTPVPITRFIWNALPFETLVDTDKSNFPKVLDFACGSGHFLTEGVSALSDYCKERHIEINDEELSSNFYGIDKDNRLTRTTQVAMLLNGANKARIRAMDGLEYSSEFYGENQKIFDIIVSNPPYSVKDFKQHLSRNVLRGSDKCIKYEVLEHTSPSSKAIENVFVERLTHVLKPNGLCAIILPSSILSHTDLATIKVREILFSHFYIHAIIAFGGKTFGTTGTNTIVLFLKRFDEPPKITELLSDSIDSIIKNEDLTDFEDQNILDGYLALQKIPKETYKAFLNGNIDKENEYFKPYCKKFQLLNETKRLKERRDFATLPKEEQEQILNERLFKYICEIERKKLTYFALTYKSQTLIVNAPQDSKEQERFLGYTISNAKSAKAGLTESGGLLSDKENRNAQDKVAFAIKQSFVNQKVQNEQIAPYLNYVKTSHLLNFESVNFNLAINLHAQSTNENLFENCKYELVCLGEVLKSLGKGKRPASFEDKSGAINFYKSSLEVYKCNQADFELEALIIGDGGSANVHYVNGHFSSSDHTYIYTSAKDSALLRYVYFVLRSNLNLLEAGFKGIGLKNIAKKFIENEVKIPLPPLEIQKQIITECERVDIQLDSLKIGVEQCQKLIKAILIKTRICAESELENLREGNKTFVDVDELINALLDSLKYLESTFDFSPLEGLDSGQRHMVSDAKALLKSLPNPPTNGWERVKLGELGQVRMCKRVMKSETNDTEGIPFYKIGTFGGKADSYIHNDLYQAYKTKYPYPKRGEVLISAAGTLGKAVIFDGGMWGWGEGSSGFWLEHVGEFTEL